MIIIAIAIFLIMTFMKPKNNKKELESSLKEMGIEFYENFYYEQVGTSIDERTNLLSKYTDIGIKVDLDNLERYNSGKFKDKISEFKNARTNEKCSRTDTKVIIYPKSPYQKKDYKIEIRLDCGFEEE